MDEYFTKVFAFVQLVEPLTFDKEPPHNWCFHEYKRFSANPVLTALLGDRDRHYFILTEPQLSAIQPANLYVPFSKWAERIENLKQIHITLDGERNTTLRDKIRSVAIQILVLRAEIIEHWLR